MRYMPVWFPRSLFPLVIILVLGPVVTAAEPCTAAAAGVESVTRQVNGRTVMPYLAAEAGPSIWSDHRGVRAVDRKDRSWRAHLPTITPPDTGGRDMEWETSGPFAADINHILISHSNPNVVYVAVACGGEPFLGGIFRSTNAGQDWIRLDTDDSMGPVYSVSMNPDNALELFAATEMGLFRTTNGGNSWTRANPVIGTYPRSLEVSYNPADGEELIAHFECTPLPASALFRSTDGGDSFSPIGSGLPQPLEVSDICFDPQVSTRCYLSAGSSFGDSGFYITEDSGGLWQSFSDGLDGMPVNSISVKADGANTSVMVSTGRAFAGQVGGLYRRAYPASEWSRVAPDVIKDIAFLEVQRDDQSPDLILLGTQGLGMMKSTDDGLSWASVNNGLSGDAVNCIAFRQDGLALHAGCDSMGFFTSQDECDSWVASSEGINMVKVTDVAVDALDPDRIIVSFTSLNSGGIFITEDGGSSWYAAPNLADQRAQSVALEGGDSQVIYAALEGPVTTEIPEGIYKSTDGGQSWTCTGPEGPAYLNNLLSKVVSEEGGGILLAGGCGYVTGLPARIFRSTDGGGNWLQVYQGENYSTVTDFSLSPGLSSVGYAALDHSGGISGMGGVLKTSNGGSSWFSVNNGFNTGPRSCRTVAVDPNDPFTAYATLLNSGVYKTSNGGASWQLTGFPAGQSLAVFADPLSHSMVYACSGGFAVLRSKDGGDEYQDFGNGYPESYVYRFGFDDRIWQPRLYACGNQGLYCLDLEPLGLPDTLDLTLACTPETLVLPETVLLDLSLTNCCHLVRSYGLTIDLELPGGAAYIAFRRGSLVLGAGQVFNTVAPIDFPMFGTLVGVTTLTLTGTDTTPPGSDGGLPGGYSDGTDCQVMSSMP